MAVAAGLAAYRFDLPMTIRSSLYQVLGDHTWGWIGDVIDGFCKWKGTEGRAMRNRWCVRRRMSRAPPSVIIAVIVDLVFRFYHNCLTLYLL